MKVRNLLVGGIALAFALVVTRLSLVEWHLAQSQHIDAFHVEVERMSRHAAKLLALSQDDLLNGSPPALHQWQAVQAEVAQALPSPDRAPAELRGDISVLRAAVDKLPGLFALIAAEKSGGGSDPHARPRRELLAGQLAAGARCIIDGAFELSEKLEEIRREQANAERQVTWATMMAFSALLLAISVIVSRRMLDPLVRLQNCAEAVQRGNLAARSGYRGNDEFGRLSLSFDKMARTVEDHTATLEAAQRDLQRTLNVNPAVIGYWDKTLHNRLANCAHLEWFGIEPERMFGMHVSQVLGSAYEASRPYLEAVLRGEPQLFERNLPRPDGNGVRHTITHYIPDEVDGVVRGFYSCVVDITQQTRDKADLAAALRENEALLSTIRMHAIVSMADRSGTIIEANDNFCRITGYSRDELIGRNHRIVNSGVQDRAFWVEMWRTIAAGRPWRGEICNRAKDGSLYWVDSIIAPFVGSDGKIEKYISIRTDITAAKRTEQHLQQANDRFERAADSADVGVGEFDVQTNTLTWDDRMYRLYGRVRSGSAEPLAMWEATVHPDDRAALVTLLHGALRGDCEFDPEFRVVWPNGEVRHLKANAKVIRDADGKALRMTGINIDITNRKRVEQALQLRERLMRLVIESFPGPLAHWDTDMRCTFANQAYLTWFGLNPDDMLGRTQQELFGADTFRLNEALMRAALRGEEQRVERSRKMPDGRTRHYLLHYVPDRDGEAVSGYISVVMDVTQIKEAQELEMRTHQAEHASEAKSRFLANMSHEIRTPMNAVIGLSYLLEQTALDPEQADFLDKIRLSSKILLALINDVLDLSKIEAGELHVERAPFDLRGLLQDLGDMMMIQATAKDIGFEVDVAADVPRALEGDAMRLTQILTNLSANAIKFTEKGQVRVGVSNVGDTAEGLVRLRFTVQDSGIGIDAEVQAKLFAPFAQADVSTTRRFGGTGLGLSIVKHLTDLMGGAVSLTSVPGEGSEFRVELAFGHAAGAGVLSAPSARTVKSRRNLAGVRVLVVDDSEINQYVAKRIIELEGAHTTLAGNGEEACRLLKSAPKDFDVVLMDAQMPVLDGYKATLCIRRELGLKALPIIALTAGALSSERKRADDAGMNGFISKPFDPRDLVRCMLRHVRPQADTAASLSGAEACPSDFAPWPEVDGIDSADVSLRLSGDVTLFRSMLKRLLEEFNQIPWPPDVRGPQALSDCAARMHKLRGGAGLLGAKLLHKLAHSAEAACLAGDATRAAQLMDQVASKVEQLRLGAGRLLSQAAVNAALPDAQVPVTADPKALAALLEMLREQNLAALDLFSAVSQQIRQAIGQPACEAVRDHIDNLQFADALLLLEP